MKIKPRLSRDEKAGCLLFSVLALIAALCFILVAFWTDRTLDFWLTYAKGTSTDCPFWLSCLVTLFLNGIIVGANIISEIARLVL